MTLFGTSIETIYLILLMCSGILIILYLFFGDILEGVGEAVGFLNPALILAFMIFFSASGYVLEIITSIPSLIIIAISMIIALILDTLLNVFVLIPMSSAEESLIYTEESLKGRIGKIIIPIPKDGFGEVFIESKSGMISRPAMGYENNAINEGSRVLVIEVIKGVLYVVPYENELDVQNSV